MKRQPTSPEPATPPTSTCMPMRPLPQSESKPHAVITGIRPVLRPDDGAGWHLGGDHPGGTPRHAAITRVLRDCGTLRLIAAVEVCALAAGALAASSLHLRFQRLAVARQQREHVTDGALLARRFGQRQV